MKRYLRVYGLLLRLNISTLVIYRANFYNSLLASVVWGLFSLGSIVLLTSKTPTAFGWTRDQLLLLNGMYGVLVGLFHVFCTRNFERFSTLIHTGQLDSLLLKPIDAQFLVSFWLVAYTNVVRALIALGYVWYLTARIGISISAGQIVLFVVAAVAGLAILYSIWYIVITTTVWLTKLYNLVELMYTVTGLARYPQGMFRELTWYAFLVLVPLTSAITVPVRVYLSAVEPVEVVKLVIVSVALVTAARRFWIFALRFYTSASG